MNLIMNLSVKRLPKLSMLTIVFFAFCLSACEKEPLPPAISQVKTCTESLVDNILCGSNLNSFSATESKIYTSALFANIDADRLILFTLFGKDSNGNWINVLETSTRPSEQGSFDDDASTFRMNVHFTKPPADDWPRTDYRVEVEINGEDGDMESIEFEVI